MEPSILSPVCAELLPAPVHNCFFASVDKPAPYRYQIQEVLPARYDFLPAYHRFHPIYLQYLSKTRSVFRMPLFALSGLCFLSTDPAEKDLKFLHSIQFWHSQAVSHIQLSVRFLPASGK